MEKVKVYIKGQEDKELYSFLRYYPMRIKKIGIEDIVAREMVNEFKSGLVQQSIAKCVAKELVRIYGRKVKNVVFSCIPASSQEKNEIRNKAFSALVCQFSGAIDGYSHVKVLGERTSVHGTKVKKEIREQRMNEQNSIEVDAPFFFGKNVCIWDDIVTTGTSFCYFTSQLEKVGAHVTNGFFLGKTSYKYRPQS